LAPWSQISLADARQRARELLRDISLGADPLAVRETDELAVMCERFKEDFCGSPERSQYVREHALDPLELRAHGRLVAAVRRGARTGKGYMAIRSIWAAIEYEPAAPGAHPEAAATPPLLSRRPQGATSFHLLDLSRY
jgi:hypothetical protein